jgi:hypothetical protein
LNKVLRSVGTLKEGAEPEAVAAMRFIRFFGIGLKDIFVTGPDSHISE